VTAAALKRTAGLSHQGCVDGVAWRPPDNRAACGDSAERSIGRLTTRTRDRGSYGRGTGVRRQRFSGGVSPLWGVTLGQSDAS
jgi:hypothetical protein